MHDFFRGELRVAERQVEVVIEIPIESLNTILDRSEELSAWYWRAYCEIREMRIERLGVFYCCINSLMSVGKQAQDIEPNHSNANCAAVIHNSLLVTEFDRQPFRLTQNVWASGLDSKFNQSKSRPVHQRQKLFIEPICSGFASEFDINTRIDDGLAKLHSSHSVPGEERISKLHGAYAEALGQEL